MPNGTLRAKVFISCGQTRGSDEEEIAHRIAERLIQLGYDPYIAIEEQTLRGIKENIFYQLKTSEYFIFIDFKREQIIVDKQKRYRGSLFCHQELALASYLDIPLIAFQEQGIIQRDGLMNFLQANSIPFTDRNLLPNVIADTIQQRGWDPLWKNQLLLERDPEQFVNATRLPENQLARFFHIRVRNLHPRKAAINCYGYIEHAYDISSGRDINIETIEFKWQGYTLPNAVIGPNSSRQLDAFYVFYETPTRLRFNLYTDFSGYVPRINGPGDFKFIFLVISENFPPARNKFTLHIGNTIDDIHFQLATS